jgi:hypothetical protein
VAIRSVTSKKIFMPNSANRSHNKTNAGQGQPKSIASDKATSKNNKERSDRKQGGSPKERPGDTGRSSSQGRKTASGGEAES